MALRIFVSRQNWSPTVLSFRPAFRRRLGLTQLPVRMIQHSARRLTKGKDHQTRAPTTEPRLDRQSPRSRRVRWYILRPIFYSTAFLLFGVLSGQLFCAVVFPPPLPEPGSQIDQLQLARARKALGALPLVKELRARRDVWLEYDAYMAMNPDEATKNMTAGLLQGSRAIAVQRVFLNKAEGRLIGVIFLGGAMAGWPGVLHGGSTATILQENLERVAGGPELGVEPRQDYQLRNFTIRYRKPANAGQIYVIRAEIDGDSNNTQGEHDVKAKATLEASDGTIVTEAQGVCSKHI